MADVDGADEVAETAVAPREVAQALCQLLYSPSPPSPAMQVHAMASIAEPPALMLPAAGTPGSTVLPTRRSGVLTDPPRPTGGMFANVSASEGNMAALLSAAATDLERMQEPTGSRPRKTSRSGSITHKLGGKTEPAKPSKLRKLSVVSEAKPLIETKSPRVQRTVGNRPMAQSMASMRSMISLQTSMTVGNRSLSSSGTSATMGKQFSGQMQHRFQGMALSEPAQIERRKLLDKFLAKRKKRVWTKKIKYNVRKDFADKRVRVKGRFISKEDEAQLLEALILVC